MVGKRSARRATQTVTEYVVYDVRHKYIVARHDTKADADGFAYGTDEVVVKMVGKYAVPKKKRK